MKRIESDQFRARLENGGGYLCLRGIPYSVDDVKREIDYSNKRAAEKGYKPERYLITHTEHYLYTDDDGRFIKSETIETGLEYYPNEA